MNCLIVLSALVATVLCRGSGGPTAPLNGLTAYDCPQEGAIFADEHNMCWYHLCVKGADGHLSTIPRSCAGGSRVSYFYTVGISNPCTVNFNMDYGWSCKRTQASHDVAPACTSDGSVVCYNGGTLTYENGVCWCLCPADWQGDWDCSKPTGYYHGAKPNSNICPYGNPEADYCALVGGCLNGGVCFNQCDGFWCSCANRETIDQVGKRCEQDVHYEKSGYHGDQHHDY